MGINGRCFPLYNVEVIDAIVNRALTIYPQLRESRCFSAWKECGHRHGNVWLPPQPWNPEQTCGQSLSSVFIKMTLIMLVLPR